MQSTAAVAAFSISLPLSTLPAKSEDLLAEWERVYLPIDPGVVLLDISFVPDDLSHGIFSFCLGLIRSCDFRLILNCELI